MGNKARTAFGMVLSAIGASLVYVSYTSYNSISADSPYAESNPVINVILIAIGGLTLLVGLVIFFQVFSNKKNSK